MATTLSNFADQDLAALPSIARGEARVHRVPPVAAGKDSLRGFGRIVTDFAQDQVTIVTWPQPAWRPIVAGTGNEGGTVEDRFVMERRGEVQHAVNLAVGRRYITGWFADPATASEVREPSDTSRLYTHEANYHPDGGQIFFPRDGAAFVALAPTRIPAQRHRPVRRPPGPRPRLCRHRLPARIRLLSRSTPAAAVTCHLGVDRRQSRH
jgi:hypothetical protein